MKSAPRLSGGTVTRPSLCGRTAARWRVLFSATAVTAALILLAALIATGALWPTRPFALRYSVQGVDVSSYQGDIDWQTLARENIDFAWIKATEGSSYRDPRFAANWAGAHRTDLLVGAYHFLSLDSSSEDQAANIESTVPRRTGDLPIAVDVECYGRYCGAPPSRSAVRKTLDPLLVELKQHYGRPPVLYATRDWYQRYLAGAYPDDPIWFRSVLTPPALAGSQNWTLWQWSPRERLSGTAGEYIDRDAFRGGLPALKKMLLP